MARKKSKSGAATAARAAKSRKNKKERDDHPPRRRPSTSSRAEEDSEPTDEPSSTSSTSSSSSRRGGGRSPLTSSVVAAKEEDVQKNNYEKTQDYDDDEGISRRHQKRRKDSSGGGGGGKNDGDGRMDREIARKRKLSEEAALAARLFGGDGNGDAQPGGAWMDDDDDDAFGLADSDGRDAERGQGDGGNNGNNDVLFAIDRSGEEVGDDAQDERGDDVEYGQEGGEDYDSDDDDEPAAEDVEREKSSMIGAAWQDDSDSEEEDSDDDDDDDDSGNGFDDNNISKQSKGVSLVDGPNRLKKLRRYRDETDPLSISEYELRLRERYVSTASAAARTDWADVGLAQKWQQRQGGEGAASPPVKRKKKKDKGGYVESSEEEEGDEEEEDAASRILRSNASLFASKSRSIPPTLLDVVRTRDANLVDPNNSVVSSCQFHPGSDKEAPLLMTAGMDKMLRFFRIDGDSNTDGSGGGGAVKEVGRGEDHSKVHGIHFPKMPITQASFLGNTGSVILAGRRPFFFTYDAVSGSVRKTTAAHLGRKERSLEKFVTSPDGRYIAFMGNDGYVILVDGKSGRWMGDLKMNGSARAICFSPDGEYVLGSGSDGDVYRWHVGSRRCVERFHNEDGTITSSLALSPNNFLAVGAESGVVNLYDDGSRSRGGIGLSAISERSPLKSVMNLATSADSLRFNHDGNILALSTRRETNGLRLLHVPTATVFSNWPTSKTPLKYVWSTDFSPGSRYLAVGNDHGKCLLYRLKHYWDE